MLISYLYLFKLNNTTFDLFNYFYFLFKIKRITRPKFFIYLINSNFPKKLNKFRYLTTNTKRVSILIVNQLQRLMTKGNFVLLTFRCHNILMCLLAFLLVFILFHRIFINSFSFHFQ